ncbi:MAG: hypothetical protein J6L86_03250 [Alphaproteobacteria bacterium]|nr:hypothetical protein [Alphaproteobacteria bacterium]
MMNRLFVLTVAGMFCALSEVRAADDFSGGVADELSGLGIEAEGVQSFQGDKDGWRRDGEKAGQTAETGVQKAAKDEVLQPIVDSIGRPALENITDAEQVFCYEVASRSNTYSGYNMDGMALKGFCGVLSKEQQKDVVDSFLKTAGNVDFEKTENCIINPRIMLRFVRGVDNTDVLLSSPCHSFSVFYGGTVKTFNLKPSADKVDSIVNPMLKKRQDFVSPALLNQLLPVGVAQTEEQKALINKRKQPVRGWEDGKPQEEKKTGGWNKVNLNIGN